MLRIKCVYSSYIGKIVELTGENFDLFTIYTLGKEWNCAYSVEIKKKDGQEFRIPPLLFNLYGEYWMKVALTEVKY